MFNEDPVVRKGGHTESPLHQLLQVSKFHRLHPGLVLVGLARLDPVYVLELRWSQVVLGVGLIGPDGEMIRLADPICELLRWHAVRQRLDRRRSLTWRAVDQVLLDERGGQFTVERADCEMRHFCQQVGLPPVAFSSLRHPCLH